MQVQINSDDHIQGADVAQRAEQALVDKLDRFQDQITRVEVHLSDVNAARAGSDDKRCKLEARLAGRQPVLVSHEAAKVADAFDGALDKLQRALDTTLGRARDAAGRDTIRGKSGDA
jgi:ribosome-associated translation inhibitor RaiA